jgi:hypothetical protein
MGQIRLKNVKEIGYKDFAGKVFGCFEDSER